MQNRPFAACVKIRSLQSNDGISIISINWFQLFQWFQNIFDTTLITDVRNLKCIHLILYHFGSMWILLIKLNYVDLECTLEIIFIKFFGFKMKFTRNGWNTFCGKNRLVAKDIGNTSFIFKIISIFTPLEHVLLVWQRKICINIRLGTKICHHIFGLNSKIDRISEANMKILMYGNMQRKCKYVNWSDSNVMFSHNTHTHTQTINNSHNGKKWRRCCYYK